MSDNNLPRILAEDDQSPIPSWSAWEKMGPERKEALDLAMAVEPLTSLIEDDDLRGFAYFILSQTHPEFWVIPASSSGKYHPVWDNVKGGLIRHIKVTMGFALSAMRRYGYSPESAGDANYNAKFRDIIAFAVIFHDWGKNGHPVKKWGKHTSWTHGEDTAEMIEQELLPKFIKFFPEIQNLEELKDMVKEACIAIYYHYGVWTKRADKLTPSNSKLTDAARIVQEADYYASREMIKEIDQALLNKTYAENSHKVISRIKK